MKLFKNIILFTAAVLFAACQTDVETPQLYNPENFVAPVLSECGDIIVNADNSNSENVIFSWTAADFGQPVQILYSVYLTLDGKEGLIGTSNSTSFAISKGDINGIVINSLGTVANEKAEGITAYVTAQVANTSNYAPIKSEPSNAFSVQTYAAPLKWLYLCGEFSNNWEIANAPQFWETGGGTSTYTCMVDFTPVPAKEATHSFFKVTTAQDWGSANWGYNDLKPSWTCEENNDGNLSLPLADANIYEITVNTVVMTVDQKAIGKVLGLSGTFNNWGEAAADAPFAYDYMSSTWKTGVVTLEAGQEIKVRADGAWTTNWGTSGKNSTAVPGGIELAAGGDNLTVPESGNFIVVLHANRTPFVLEFQKQ